MTDSIDIKRALVQKLESLHRAGVRCVPRSKISIAPADPTPTHTESTAVPATASTATTARESISSSHSESQVAEKPTVTSTSTGGSFGAAVSPGERSSALSILADEVAGCTVCSELSSSRRQTVFGVGNPNARLVFFGEAPGADEDRQGEPFVGKAGQLLTKIIEACTLTRDDVYIMNVLKCRPPGNRNPAPDEVTNCRRFFERQFEIIRPEFVCCLGSIAATTLLQTTQSVGRLRGTFHDWRGIQVVVTYHPAYLLRNAPAKKYVWADMKMLMKEMGIDL